MLANYFIRIEFADCEPFMYRYYGTLLPDAISSARSFMDFVKDKGTKRPKRAEIWSYGDLSLVSVLDD